MQRPAGVRETLSRSPMMKTCRTDSSRVERIPLVTTTAKPVVVFARGDQPHSGHRIRGPVPSTSFACFSSWSSAGSNTVDALGKPWCSRCDNSTMMLAARMIVNTTPIERSGVVRKGAEATRKPAFHWPRIQIPFRSPVPDSPLGTFLCLIQAWAG
jgi:hypothetical protein